MATVQNPGCPLAAARSSVSPYSSSTIANRQARFDVPIWSLRDRMAPAGATNLVQHGRPAYSLHLPVVRSLLGLVV